MRAVLATITALALCAHPAGHSAAQNSRTANETPPLARVRAAMQHFVDQGQFAGAVTVVGRKEAILSFEAVGWLNIEKNVPMSKDAIFQIASMTKPITAIGIMQLQEAGKLDIDDSVAKHLLEFQGQMLVAERKADSLLLEKPNRPITIKDLLTHTSGLPAEYPAGLGDLILKRDRTLAEGTLAISQQPLTFDPGTRWAYCSPGFDTLGRIIEVLSGMPYEDYIERHVLRPLGMADTVFYFPKERMRRRVAPIYEKREGMLRQSPAPAGWVIGARSERKHPVPSGGLYSTGADLARLYRMMLNDGELGGERILSRESVKQMTSLQTGDLQAGFAPGRGFGLGWELVVMGGLTDMLSPGSYGHFGAWGTQGWLDPRRDLFTVLLIQRAGPANADAFNELQRLAVEAIR
jgi:CubicO group peptidase (beta-lactamase class C family)